MGGIARLVAFLVFFQVGGVFAESFDQRAVTAEVSPKLLETLLRAIDGDYKEVGNNAYAFTVKGKYKVVFFNKIKDVQLFVLFDTNEVSLTRINDWNTNKRFSRAYLDRENRPALESDLDVEGGVTGESIIRFIALFSESVEQFAEHIQ
ncbi:MAG: YbjN domain-containing protein [Magnetococcales bacterium]|nr:YbjN domain-containing protein [Magnetococcales bacterium]MBF0157541.1 YbjN domain-containing protein [Magnetococcales bacterium]